MGTYNMINLRALLTELILTDLTKGRTGRKYFIVYKGKLFLFDDDSKIASIKRGLRSHPEAHPEEKGRWNILNVDDANEFAIRVAELAPDILVGEWYPDTRGMVVWSEQEIIPQTSLNVKKAASQLGAVKITYRYFDYMAQGDSAEKDISVKKATGHVPNIVYHGTTSKHLKSILSYGLEPGVGKSKFASREIYHPEHIFFVATFEGAMYYAENAVHASEKELHNWDNYPIIIEFEIPDTSLLVPDYDADVSTTSKPYFQRAREPREKTSMKASGVSREVGKWGYKGRIPHHL